MAITNVQALLNLKAGLAFSVSESEFPASPVNGQMCMVGGIIYVYADIGNSITWYPLNNKKKSHIHTQEFDADSWIISHGMNSQDFSYAVYDENHMVVIADHDVIDTNTIRVNFTTPIRGTAVLFFQSEVFAPTGVDTTISAGSNVHWNPAVVSDLGMISEGDTVNISVEALSAYPDPVTYTVTGDLPAGLSIVNGTLQGTASNVVAGGTFDFTLTASNGVSDDLSRDFTIAVSASNDAPSWVTDADFGLLEGAVDIQLSAPDPEGQPVNFAVVSGTWPTGMVMDSNGHITGNAPMDGQNYSITVSASDGTHTVNRTFTMEIGLPIATAENQQTHFPGSTMIEPGGQGVRFETPGTYDWTVPAILAGLTAKVWVVGGGGGYDYPNGGGGGGGAVAMVDLVAGETISLVVGSGSSMHSGGSSSFGSVVTAYGGKRGTCFNCGGAGGCWSGGYDGGCGGSGGGTYGHGQSAARFGAGGGAGNNTATSGGTGSGYGGTGGRYHTPATSYGGGSGHSRPSASGVVVIQWEAGILPDPA